jgi:hypothetical protein
VKLRSRWERNSSKQKMVPVTSTRRNFDRPRALLICGSPIWWRFIYTKAMGDFGHQSREIEAQIRAWHFADRRGPYDT